MKPQKIFVKYKGTRFLLPPGHKVYECNSDTGEVKEHKLVKAITWPWQDGKTFKCTYRHNIVHRPAFNIQKAVNEFKHMFKILIEERKKEGNPFVIFHAKDQK